MTLEENMVHAAHFDAMRRVFVPDTSDGVPDPGVDFEGCLGAVMSKVNYAVNALSSPERVDYFKRLSSDAHDWAKAHPDMPKDLLKKINYWWKANHH